MLRLGFRVIPSRSLSLLLPPSSLSLPPLLLSSSSSSSSSRFLPCRTPLSPPPPPFPSQRYSSSTIALRSKEDEMNRILGHLMHFEKHELVALVSQFKSMNPDVPLTSSSIPLDVTTYNYLLNAYMDLEEYNRFEALLRKMEEDAISPDARTYDMILKFYSKKGDLQKADELLRTMEELSLPLSESAFHSLLNLHLANGNLAKAEEIFARLKESDVTPSPIFYNKFFKKYRERGMAAEADKLFHSMKSSGVTPDSITYNTLLSLYGNVGDHESMKMISQEMKSANVPMDLVTHLALVQGYTHVFEKDAEAGMQQFVTLLDEIRSSGQTLPLVCYNVIINYLSKRHHHAGIAWVLKDMAANDVSPDMFTLSPVLKMFFDEKNAEKAEEIFKVAEEIGPTPPREMYFTLLKLHCDLKNVAGAREVLQKMADRNIVADGPGYGYAMTLYLEKNLLEDVVSLLDRMHKEKISSTSVMYNKLINGFSVRKSYKKAVEVFEMMVSHGIKCDIVSYNTLLKALIDPAAGSSLEDIKQIERRIEASGLRKTQATYTTLISFFGATGNVEEVMRIFAEMKESGTPIDTRAYNTLFILYSTLGDLDAGFRLLSEMKENGASPDVITYSSLLKICCNLKRFDKVKEVLAAMEHDSIPPSATTHSILLHYYAEIQDDAKLNKAVQVMKQKKIPLSRMDRTVLLNYYLATRNTKMASLYAKSLKSSSDDMDTIAYNSIIKASLLEKKPEHAELSIDRMIQLNIPRSHITYGTLLSYYLEENDPVNAERIFQRMLDDDNVAPNIGEVNMLLDYYLRQRDNAKVTSLLERSNELKLEKDVITYSILMKESILVKDFEGILSHYQAAVKSGITLDDGFFSQLVTLYSSNGKFEEAEAVVRDAEKAGFMSSRVVGSLLHGYVNQKPADWFPKSEAIYNNAKSHGYLNHFIGSWMMAAWMKNEGVGLQERANKAMDVHRVTLEFTGNEDKYLSLARQRCLSILNPQDSPSQRSHPNRSSPPPPPPPATDTPSQSA